MRSLLGVVWLVMALNILLSLATPVFIDGDREDYNVDLQDVEQEKHLDFPMTREFRINHFNEISFDDKVMRSTNCSSDQLDIPVEYLTATFLANNDGSDKVWLIRWNQHACKDQGSDSA